jgi:hypothetical protein
MSRALAVPLCIALGVGLLGCAPGVTAPHLTAATRTASPTPAETRAALIQQALAATSGGHHDGAAITEAQAKAVLAGSTTHGAYEMHDGTWVITDLSRALPAAVQRDADRQASKLLHRLTKGKSGNKAVDASSRAVIAIGSSALDSEHRQAVNLVLAWSSVPMSWPVSWSRVWVLNGVDAQGFQVPTKAAGIAAYKKYLRASTGRTPPPALVIAE